jgi:hypothetical protein
VYQRQNRRRGASAIERVQFSVPAVRMVRNGGKPGDIDG